MDKDYIMEAYGMNYEIARTFIDSDGWLDTSGTSYEMRLVYRIVRGGVYETRETQNRKWIRPIELKMYDKQK